MAGAADNARMCIFLLFIAVLIALGFYPAKKTISVKAEIARN